MVLPLILIGGISLIAGGTLSFMSYQKTKRQKEEIEAETERLASAKNNPEATVVSTGSWLDDAFYTLRKNALYIAGTIIVITGAIVYIKSRGD